MMQTPCKWKLVVPDSTLGRKGAVMFTAGSRNAIEQHKKIEGKSKSGKLTNGRLKIEGVFVLTVLLLTQHPQTGFLGSLSKDFARPITLLSIIFQSGMKEAFLPLSLSVNPAFITS